MNEEWRNIEGYEGYYQVSNEGRVKSLERFIDTTANGTPCLYTVREKILKFGRYAKNGYLNVHLSKYGKSEVISVHRLVARAFLGERQKGLDICHCDGNPKNNNIENLRYDSHKNNSADMKIHGTLMKGEKNPNNKYTIEQAEMVKQLLLNEALSIKKISEITNVKTFVVICINNGKSWRNENINYPIREIKTKKLTENIQEIYYLLENTELSYAEIARMFSVASQTIQNINKGTRWHIESMQYPIRPIKQIKTQY